MVLKGMDGKEVEMAIDVSDLQFIKDLNLGYDDVYIGFPGDEQGNHDCPEKIPQKGVAA